MKGYWHIKCVSVYTSPCLALKLLILHCNDVTQQKTSQKTTNRPTTLLQPIWLNIFFCVIFLDYSKYVTICVWSVWNKTTSTEGAISTALHSVLTHLETTNSHISFLFVDFSSIFDTVSPMKLTGQLNTVGLSTTLCNWILDFLTSRRRRAQIGCRPSSTLVLNTRAPHGCVLSPLLNTVHPWLHSHRENSIV